MIKQIDAVVYLLTFLVIFFTVLLLVCAQFLTSDGQTFQVISGALTGVLGALLMRVKPQEHKEPSPGSSRATATFEAGAPADPPKEN